MTRCAHKDARHYSGKWCPDCGGVLIYREWILPTAFIVRLWRRIRRHHDRSR